MASQRSPRVHEAPPGARGGGAPRARRPARHPLRRRDAATAAVPPSLIPTPSPPFPTP
jgi:hypothetical protein